MENSKSKIPSGITKDIVLSPEEKKSSKSIFGFSTSPTVESSTPITDSTSSSSVINSKSSSETNSSITSLIDFGKFSLFRIVMIIIILLFLGVNIFSYLGDFLQNIKDSDVIKNILQTFGYAVTETTKDITKVTAEGAELGIDIAAGTIESGIDVIQGQLDIDQTDNKQKNNDKQKQNKQATSLSSVLADAEYRSDPLPDDATSSTQRAGSGKSGYCYIGEDRGFRSCIKVKENDVCMSGEIFPSQEICVNPTLRE